MNETDTGRSRYRELPPPPACRHVLSCTWEQRTGPGEDYPQLVLPDGHADLVVDDAGRAVLVGPATGVSVALLPPGGVVCGLRLSFPAVRPVLGVPAVELTDRVVPLSGLLGEARAGLVADALGGGDPTAWSRIHHWLAGAELDPRARVAAATLWHRPGTEVGVVAERVGLSGRQLRRVLRAEVGLGPRTFQRIGRLQRFLASARRGTGLAELAAGSGYADQSHLSREARSLTGLTAAELLVFQLG